MRTPNTLQAMADVPGTLTASAVMTTYPDQDSGESCTVSGSATFEIKQATVPVVTLGRPRPLLSDPPLLWDSEWRLLVALGPTIDRSPLTVEARAIRRAKLPGKGAKRKTRTIALRASDQVEDDESDQGQLITSPTVNSWPKGAEVDVFSKRPEADRADDASERIPGRAAEPAPCRSHPSGWTSGSSRAAARSAGSGSPASATAAASSTSAASRRSPRSSSSRFPPVEQDLGRP